MITLEQESQSARQSGNSQPESAPDDSVTTHSAGDKDTQAKQDDRYSRQILFRGIGAEGQKKLAAARVAIVGCGATGSALAGLLARAGVGTLRIIDRDYVEPSNLQRQSLFDEKDAAESLPKAIAATRKIAAFNSEIALEPKVEDLVPANIEVLLEGMSLILDGTDNFETRYLINDYAVDRSLPWIYSAAVGSYAVTLNIVPKQTACLACIFPDSPRGMVETCETSGILNSAVNLVASIAATEALKFLVERFEFSAASANFAFVRSLDQRACRNLSRQATTRLPGLRRTRLHSSRRRRSPAHHLVRQEFRANP